MREEDREKYYYQSGRERRERGMRLTRDIQILLKIRERDRD